MGLDYAPLLRRFGTLWPKPCIWFVSASSWFFMTGLVSLTALSFLELTLSCSTAQAYLSLPNAGVKSMCHYNLAVWIFQPNVAPFILCPGHLRLYCIVCYCAGNRIIYHISSYLDSISSTDPCALKTYPAHTHPRYKWNLPDLNQEADPPQPISTFVAGILESSRNTTQIPTGQSWSCQALKQQSKCKPLGSIKSGNRV